jgi:hypothetical protein
MLGWLFISQYRERSIVNVRNKAFLTIIILGLITEASWLLWAKHHPVMEWPVHGFQESYLAQLRLKNGNTPELGMATWQDVLKRPLENEDDMATAMGALFTHKGIAPAWYSPATVIPLALLLFGLGESFRSTGGDITEWYFLAYQVIYLFWPWNYEWRFQMPVAPLAALYMWRGSRLLWHWARMRPRLIYAIVSAVTVLGIISTTAWGMHTRHPSGLVCLMLWLLIGILSTTLLAGTMFRTTYRQRLFQYSEPPRWLNISRTRLAYTVVLASLVATGVSAQIREGMDNLHRVPEMDPNVEAALWVKAHSAPDTVVMARWEAMVYHYSGRRVIWFPASTDPVLLAAGIRRFHIRFIVLTENDTDSYWTPSDSRCFGVLLRAYPEMFHQIHKGEHEQIYEYAERTHRNDENTMSSRSFTPKRMF